MTIRGKLMSNIGVVINFEVLRSVRKKSFWYAALAVPLLIIVIYTVSYISSNDASKTSQQQTASITKTSKIAVLDDTGLINTKSLTKQHIATEPSQQAGINAVKVGKIDAFFYYPKDVTKSGIEVYAKDQGLISTPSYNTVAVAILKLNVIGKVSAATHSNLVAGILETDPSVTTTTYKNGQQTNSAASIVVPGLFMITYLVIVVLTAYLMISSTSEEKENRVAEILLTSVKARTVIIGKILSILVLGIVQIFSIAVPIIVAYIIFNKRITLPYGLSISHLPINTEAVTFGALFLVGGLVLFTGFLVGLSALFPSAQEAGRYLGIAIMSAFIPIYAIGFILSSPNSFIVNVFTYFPLTAPTTALIRNALGAISTTDAIISLAIVYVGATLAILFAVRAFRYGAMEYGRRIGIKELFR
jgi:ABC-2 type transport system permease protein